MSLKVPYVPDERIEQSAQALLADYAQSRGVTIDAPIPIDDIIEKHLKLSIDFDDMHQLFQVPRSKSSGNPDILGAIFFDRMRIVIDESLDPDADPEKEGRYRYTAAHELGHWQLHRDLFAKDPSQKSFCETNSSPNVVCRSSQVTKERIEIQADLYAACLLMPRDLVIAAWAEAFPDGKQRVLQPETPIDHPLVEIIRSRFSIFGVEYVESDDMALDSFAEPFAKKFLVSPVAMRIRLERLGLLHRAVPLQRILIGGK